MCETHAYSLHFFASAPDFVSLVLLGGRNSQITPAIIQSVMIYVVDVQIWAVSGRVPENESMHGGRLAIHRPVSISVVNTP